MSAAPPISREALQRAAQVAGGWDPLAQRLGVRAQDLRRWSEGEEEAPAAVVFAALGIVEAASRRG